MDLLVSAAQMRALDEDTIARLGVPGAVLMESAGRGVVSELWALHGRGVIDLRRGRAVVVAGPGNNGGDGLVIARALHGAGVAVQVLLCCEAERLRGDAQTQLRLAQASGVAVQAAAGAHDLPVLGRQDVLVDALLGTGLTRPVSGALAEVITAMNRSAAVRVAVDVPSGLDADRGEPQGEGQDAKAIVKADHTVTFAWAKLGLASAPGFSYAGRVTVVDIGIPVQGAERLGVRARLLGPELLEPLWTPRDAQGHKGSHGHLLIIAGSPGKTGAALLSAHGAQAAGVGLCTLAVPSEAREAIQGRVLEAMTQTYAAQAPAQAWPELTRGKRALVIGPGLPAGEEVLWALLQLLAQGDAPLVLDADALNQLAGDLTVLRQATQRGRRLVLTPHPGEAARLLGCDTQSVQADRVAAARRLGQETGAVVVLKGARTLVAAGDQLSVCPTGNAGMGSGGMGDALSGIIGALLASGLHDPKDPDGGAYWAACAGVYWHGLAGDCLLARRFPAALLRASELCESLPEAVQRAQQMHRAAEAASPCHRPLLPDSP